MPAVLMKIGASLLSSLMTEKVLKELILFLLEKIVNKTKMKEDNELLEIIKKAWK